jgi:hypothetical protein
MKLIVNPGKITKQKTFNKSTPDPYNVDLATIWLPYAGATTGLKSVFDRGFERRPLAGFRLVVGPA